MDGLKRVTHETDLCVIGGGLAGTLAAVAAARHGAKVVLMQDRPVLGGNSSSEIRMWVSGAGSRVRNLQETGIMEEILLTNMDRNPTRNFSIWDSILYEKVRFEPNITLLLNCACCQAEMKDATTVAAVTGFQLTTYTWHTVRAKLFADCSGDSILAELTGAEYRVGREAKDELGESLAPDVGDRKTMGMSLMIQAHETDHPVSFTPPPWAYVFPTDEAMKNKPHESLEKINTNFYWIELGGEQDSIHDTEEIRDELLKIAFGVWDHVKNQGDHGAENWELDFIGFLPGKRESRRYVGDYVLRQDDLLEARVFPDAVAYGGWQIDNHLPGGFFMDGKGGAHLQKVRLREPYTIPFRSLYSVNIRNLMFAGRNISASHLAFGSTRVMATCGILGQAVGTAAALMLRRGMTPRELGRKCIGELQAALMEDDCFLPGFRRTPPRLSREAELTAEYGDPSALLSGLDRKIWGCDNGYWGMCGRAITYTFRRPERVAFFRLIADSDLDREYTDGNPDALNISATLFRRADYNHTTFGFPKCLLKSFRVEILTEADRWETVWETDRNTQRLVCAGIHKTAKAVRLIPLSTWFSESLTETYGSAQAHVFAFDVTAERDPLPYAASVADALTERQAPERPRFIAHRGFTPLAPENSLPAWEEAGRRGAWAIETDVHVTKDGVLVCCHDSNLLRTFGVDCVIEETSFDELRRFRISRGNGLDRLGSDALRLPTFEEYLAVCVKYGAVPFLETKGDVVAAVIDVLRQEGLIPYAVLSSTHFSHVEEAHRLCPELFVHHIFSDEAHMQILSGYAHAGLSYDYPDLDLVPEGLIERTHAAGVKVCLRAGDSPEAVRRMLALGLDYIPTNDLGGQPIEY